MVSWGGFCLQEPPAYMDRTPCMDKAHGKCPISLSHSVSIMYATCIYIIVSYYYGTNLIYW